jgi:hypothetical protein
LRDSAATRIGEAELESIVVDVVVVDAERSAPLEPFRFCGATGKTLNGVVSPPPDRPESEVLPASPTTRRTTAAIISTIMAGRRVLGFLRG